MVDLIAGGSISVHVLPATDTLSRRFVATSLSGKRYVMSELYDSIGFNEQCLVAALRLLRKYKLQAEIKDACHTKNGMVFLFWHSNCEEVAKQEEFQKHLKGF